jgi:hypothetical protein
MHQSSFENWRRESEAVNGEMDSLLSAGWPKTVAECQVRKLQFMALVERRDVAAREFLKPCVLSQRQAMASRATSPRQVEASPGARRPSPEGGLAVEFQRGKGAESAQKASSGSPASSPEPGLVAEFYQGEGVQIASTTTSRHRVEASSGSPGSSAEPSLAVEFQPGGGVEISPTATLDHPVEASPSSPGCSPEPALAIEFR